MGSVFDAWAGNQTGDSSSDIVLSPENYTFDKEESFFDKLTSKLLGLFENGITIYKSVTDRLQAAEIIKEETVEEEKVIVKEPAKEISPDKDKRMMILGIGGAVLGTLLLIKILKK